MMRSEQQPERRSRDAAGDAASPGGTAEPAPPTGVDAADDLSALERQELLEQLQRRTQQLEESEDRFRSIIQRTADGIAVVGGEGRLLFLNPAAEQLFGRPAADLLGRDFGLPISASVTEIEILRPGRMEAVVAELRVVAMRWAGEPAYLVSLRDITDRKQAEERAHRLALEQLAREQAEAAEQRARFLAEASGTLDSSLDPGATLANLARLLVPRLADWVVIDLIERDQLRRVGSAHVDAASQELLEELRMHYPARPDSNQPSSQAIRTGSPVLLTDLDADKIRELSYDERHAVLLERLGTRSAVAVPLESRGNTLGAMTLVRQDRNYDRAECAMAAELGRRAGQAIDNARLYYDALTANRAKSDFLAVVSHELRTPLNAIMGYTEILQSGLSGTLQDRQLEQLRRITTSAKHLLQIIEEILAYARMEAGREELRPAPITIRELVQEVVVVAEPLVREQGLDFRLRIDDAETHLITDPGKVRQILLNLLSNAAKFTHEGTVGLGAAVRENDLVLTVTDTGIGIAPEHLDSIFESFWQEEHASTRRTGGTGLGLSVSKRLAEILGGALTVTSELGRGSTFQLRIPTRTPLH